MVAMRPQYLQLGGVGGGVARLDPQGRCIYVNERFAKILGVTTEEILGTGWQRMSPAFASRIFANCDKLRSGVDLASLETYARADGRRVAVVVESIPELDERGRLESVLVTGLDVTTHQTLLAESAHHRERAAARLEEIAEVYENTPVALCGVDLDFRYVRTNRLYAEIVGYEPDDLIGRSMWDVVPPSAREEAVGMARQCMETGRPVLGKELKRILPGQTEPSKIWLVNVHPVRWDGRVTGSMAVLQDITDARRAEQTAQARLAELEALYANSPVGLTLVDRDLRYVRVNQAIADLNGLSVEEVIGKTYRDLAPETADLAEPFLREVAARGLSVRNLEVKSRPPADPENEHVFLLSADPMRDADGEVTGLVSAVHDVTELRRAERIAAERLAELELVYANAPVGLCYVDTELRVKHLNTRFAVLGDRPVAELVGAHLAELLPAELAGQLLPQLCQVIRTGMDSIGSQLHGRPASPAARDFTWIVNAHPQRKDGAVTGVIIVLEDVSTLVDRQHELEAVRDRLDEAQRVSKVGSWEWDIVEDTVWWSPALYEIFGEPHSFVPTWSEFFERVHRKDRRRVRDQIEQTLGGDELYHLRLRIHRSDGAERTLSTAARLERSPDGRPARLVGTCQDITDFAPAAKPRARGRRTAKRTGNRPAR